MSAYHQRLSEYHAINRLLSEIPVLNPVQTYTLDKWTGVWSENHQEWRFESSEGELLKLRKGKVDDYLHLRQQLSMAMTRQESPHHPLIYRSTEEMILTEAIPEDFTHWCQTDRGIQDWGIFAFQYFYSLLVTRHQIKKDYSWLTYHEMKLLPDLNQGYAHYQITAPDYPPVEFWVPYRGFSFVFEIKNLTNLNAGVGMQFFRRFPQDLRFLNLFLGYSLTDLTQMIYEYLKEHPDEEEKYLAYRADLKKKTGTPHKFKVGIVDYILARPFRQGYHEVYQLPPKEIQDWMKQIPNFIMLTEKKPYPLLEWMIEQFEDLLIKPPEKEKIHVTYLIQL